MPPWRWGDPWGSCTSGPRERCHGCSTTQVPPGTDQRAGDRSARRHGFAMAAAPSTPQAPPRFPTPALQPHHPPPHLRHVPWLCSMGTTRSPTRTRVTRGPTASTSPTPSWPGMPGTAKRRGYLPSMVLMSLGLTGACGVGGWVGGWDRKGEAGGSGWSVGCQRCLRWWFEGRNQQNK